MTSSQGILTSLPRYRVGVDTGHVSGNHEASMCGAPSGPGGIGLGAAVRVGVPAYGRIPAHRRGKWSSVIQFESVGKTFRDGTSAVVDLDLEVPSGQDHRDRGAVGLRQDHDAAHGQPDAGTDQGPHPVGRNPDQIPPQDDAAPPDGVRDPERRPVPAPDRGRQHRYRSWSAGLEPAEDPLPFAGVAGQRRSGQEAGHIAIRRSCPAASNSASGSPAPWPPIRW